MNKEPKQINDRAFVRLFDEVFSSDATANPSFILSSPENKHVVDQAVKVLMEVKDELPGVLVVDYTDKEACYETVSKALMDEETHVAKGKPDYHTVIFLPPIEDKEDIPSVFNEHGEAFYEGELCTYPQLIVLRRPTSEDKHRIGSIISDPGASLHVMSLEAPTDEDLRDFFECMAEATEGTWYPDVTDEENDF